jgi:hypothetical protein
VWKAAFVACIAFVASSDSVDFIASMLVRKSLKIQQLQQ